MKILYGVQGTGNGHISRARAMAKALADIPSIEVQFLFSGRPESEYFDMAVFGDYAVRRGFTFYSRAGKIDRIQTARNNNLWQFLQEVRTLDVSEYDLVISDFEPITAHAAKRKNVPSLSISHQSAFIYDVPKQGQSLLDKAIMRFFAPTALNIGLHWYHFNQPVLPPIIDLSLTQSSSKNGPVLVYLPFEQLDHVVSTLQTLSSPFVCFHPDCQQAKQAKNVALRPLSKNDFHQALFACHGVIANGGFELPSEALSLGKKLLLKPLTGQFEQQSNVTTLDMLGLASTMESLDVKVIRQWLAHSDSQRVKYPEVAKAIAQWLEIGDMDTLPELHRALWSQVEFPEHVNDLLSDFWPSQRRKQAMFNMQISTESNMKAKRH
ncbi:MJ1255/VC2487 family glycosyltransferase [Enterovibrio sp. 27052020O]|uniref:MJ1255/VC2487 family glycosyltransferase n=1 Tax=Enterovibrio sp. 27052020O TaxID=3241166 RepID=UPI00388E419B